MDRILMDDGVVTLTPYTKADAQEFMACWQDEATQRGYNFILPDNADRRLFGEITAYPFWAVATEKATGHKLGVLRLSPDDHPDLAIWVYSPHRGKGWGKRMYRLALQYLFDHGYQTIFAGCFPFNTPSLRILEQNGFIRWPEGDVKECSAFDGSEITMMGFICHR